MVEGVGGCGKVGEDGPFGEGGGVHELCLWGKISWLVGGDMEGGKRERGDVLR